MRARLRGLIGTDPALQRVAAAWFLFNLAEWAYVTAVSIHEYRLHGALAPGLIGARFIPGAVLGSLLLGALNRRSPPRVLQVLSLARCVALAGVVLALVAHAPLPVLVALVWLDAIVAAPYRPMQSMLLPALAGTPSELSAVAGSVPTMKALAQAAGALAGSVALAVVDAQTIVIATIGVMLMTALLVADIRTKPVPLPAGAQLGEDNAAAAAGLRDVRAGFVLVARRAWPLLVLGGTRTLTRGLWTSLTVVVSLRLLHLGSAGVGLLMAGAGAGAVVAVPVSLRFAGRTRLAGPCAVCFALSGIPIVLIGVIARPAPAVVLIALWGLAFALADSMSNVLIHRVVEARRLAPSVAALESSKLLLEGLGALAAPALLSVVGIRDALLIVGAPLPLLVAFSRRGLVAIDVRAAMRTRPLAALRQTWSFRGLTMLSLESLAARLRDASATAGQVIVRQDEMGDSFYLIDSGEVEVTIDGFAVTRLGPGSGFGEKALLRDTPRSATVTALGPTSLWRLEGADFVAAATGDVGRPVERVARPAALTVRDVLGGRSDVRGDRPARAGHARRDAHGARRTGDRQAGPGRRPLLRDARRRGLG